MSQYTEIGARGRDDVGSVIRAAHFQMFDSVLWYVKDFVDASALNAFIHSVTGLDWKFDIEHVTAAEGLPDEAERLKAAKVALAKPR